MVLALFATDLGENFAKAQLENAARQESTARARALVAPNLLAMLYRQRKKRLDKQKEHWKESNFFDRHVELSEAQMRHQERTDKMHEARLRLLVPESSTKQQLDVDADVSPVLIFKVFFSALQVLSLARRFEFEWPGFLKSIFVVQSSATGGNTFALDCFFPNIIPLIYERVLLMVSVCQMVCSFMLLWFNRFVCLLCLL